MQLVKLEARNFRSLKEVTVIFGRITVLIGENDAGKSSVLDLLEMLLGGRRPDDKDFFCWEECEEGIAEKAHKQTDCIEAIAEFSLEETDAPDLPIAYGKLVRIRKVWKPQSTETYYWGAKLQDAKLAQDFSKLKKPELEELIHQCDESALDGLKNNEARIAWLVEYAAAAPRSEGWMLAPVRSLNLLPRFERYRAIDYSSPDNMVMKTLRQVFEQVIYQPAPDGGDGKVLDKRLSEVKSDAEKKIRQKVAELLGFVKTYAPRITNISYDPVIDFAGGLKSGEFQIDDGRGLHYLSRIGDGTKRRIFMATLDWDRQVSVEQAQEGAPLPFIIRGYDEPDTNLHYEAQRQMYQAISDIAETPNSHIQAVLCTHSLTMIDRAPAKSINLLQLRDGCTVVDRLQTDDDPDVEQFLTEMARELGITNTIMFYERCFILVEGETEENALPLLYRNLHGRSMLEDGIRLINTKSNGAVKEFLRLLSRNRQNATIIFVDADTGQNNAGKEAKLTIDVLKQAGFSDQFITERLRFVGAREFEDAFGDDTLAVALQSGYPRKEEPWQPAHIAEIRKNADKKFSDELGRIVFQQAKEDAPNWGKPEFGKHLGRACKSPDSIPEAVKQLFDLARQIAAGK